MAKIPGRLFVDMFPDGTLRLVFLPSSGDRNACQVKVEDLCTAEVLFMTCGLSKELAADLRNEVERNRVAGVLTSVDEETAAKFRYTKPN